MKIDNIKEIIFCNKNGKPTAYAKEYGNRFTEISLNEGIKLARVVDFRILKSQEDINRLYKEVEFSRGKKKSRIIPTAVAAATAGALIFGTGAYALNNIGASEIENTKATVVESSNHVAYAEEANEQELKATEKQVSEETNNQDQVAEEETFDSLLQASESTTQKEVVQRMSDYIDYFNGDFANAYKETVELRDSEGNLTGEEIEVKPALLWNYEIPALTIAYNDYTTRELQEIFNGTELDAYTLDANYKNATLQLFGAYVISDRENPVNLSSLIESPEGKAFVEKYENLFYNIKEATTEEEEIAAVNAFYAELYRDFPIDSYSREVGISHADSRSLILDQPYKLAITPMVTATEVMYQNLAIDHTLSDEAIAYFNDLGLCNLAYSSFEKAERATEDNEFDERFADYEKLSQLKINELRQKGEYVIDDSHRDLSLLTKFQENVNGHFEIIDGEWIYTGGSVIISTTTETHEEIVDQWTKKHTTTRQEKTVTKTDDREKAVDKAGEKKVKEAEEKVDKEIEKENKKAKEEAEKKADKEQKRQQKEEDKKAEKVKEEVKQDEKDMEKKIDDANKKIDNGEKVNESDFGDHGVDFDDEHSDEQGNLDDSVEKITTDGTGAVDANDPLPDPNETGKDFDEKHKSNKSVQEESKPAKEESHQESQSKEEKHEESKPAKEESHQESQPKEEKHEESKPAKEESHQESKPKEEKHEESKPAKEESHQESQPKEEKHEESAPAKEESHQESSAEPISSVKTSHEDEEAVYYDFDDIDYEEEFTSSKSDEELVDEYVESLASQQSASKTKSI